MRYPSMRYPLSNEIMVTRMSSAEQALLELTTPACDKGIGKVILAADSKDLIADVRIQPHSTWPDDRGYFLEVARIGLGLITTFPKDTTQVSAALSYPGTIKAFHF